MSFGALLANAIRRLVFPQRATIRVSAPKDESTGGDTPVDGLSRSDFARCENRRALATLISNLPGVAYRCRNGRAWTMEFISDGCEALTGYAPAELVGNAARSFADLLYPGDQAVVRQQVQKSLEDRTFFRLVYRIRTASGEEKWVWEQGRGVWSDKGELLALEGFITDITEQKHSEQELAKARDAAEAASRAKSEFLAKVSHEIRTPMNAIIGMTELTMAAGVTPEQQTYLDTILHSASTLLETLEGILGLARVEAGRLQYEHAPFDLVDLVENVARMVAHVAATKDLEVVCDVSPDVPAWVYGDPLRLRQVLLNLAGNAVKFTDKGEVVIRVESIEVSSRSARLRFIVADTGIGIPLDRQEAVFESFTQADGGIARRYGGSGLGLAISAGIVQSFGGRIELNSEPGRGSTFHFDAGFEPCGDAGKLTVPASSQLNGRRILVAVRSERAAGAYRRRLDACGCEVIVNGSPENLTAALKNQSGERTGETFDVVVADMSLLAEIEMPGELERVRRPRLVVLHRPGELAGRLSASGAVTAPKPVTSGQLRAAVLSARDGERGDASEAGGRMARSGSCPPGAALDVERALVQLDGDRQLLDAAIASFLNSAGGSTELLRAAIVRQDAPTIVRVSHGIKGAAGCIGADAVSHIADVLESVASEGRLESALAATDELERRVQELHEVYGTMAGQ